ncbi:nucleotide-binding protein, partial [Klebsiella pneumoniae]|nr:nucleotide-binding protein [Klebsiella pneumoniae]
LKDSATTLELTAETLTINTDSEFSLDAVVTLLQTKVAKRNLSLKIFDFGKVETASGNRVRQVITLQRGLSSELAKDLSKQIRDQFKKVQVSIQGDALRVSAKSKDDLQTVIQYLKQQDVPAPLQFTNYR